jgi:hypothetical protein
MPRIPDEAPPVDDDSTSRALVAVLLLGLIMTVVDVLYAPLKAYETALLYRVYLGQYPDQFAFLRIILPSPAFDDLLGWENLVILQILPFLLFFYFAVRMRIGVSARIIPAVVAMVVIGAGLSVLSYSLSYPYQIDSSQYLSPIGVLSLVHQGAEFAALGLTGLAFGSFSGDTPHWILKSWLVSRERTEEEEPVRDPANPV